MNLPPHNLPTIGISRCLLGDTVRYDGTSKHHPELIKQLRQVFNLLPVCPEVEAGLPVPRPAVQLTASIDQPRLTGRDDPAIDITELMQTYCITRPADLIDISGFVFKSRSPSCGMGSTPVYIDGDIATDTSSGVFSRAMLQLYPKLPVIEETGLNRPEVFQEFKSRVLKYSSQHD